MNIVTAARLVQYILDYDIIYIVGYLPSIVPSQYV